MADLIDFLPLRRETIEDIRARIDADANAGLDPSDERWIDLTEGGHFWDITQTVGLEIERLWDAAATDVPAAAFVAYAWGSYLDEHGETYNVPRKGASYATGTVRFSGTPGTFVAEGTRVGVPTASGDQDAIEFVTTESGTVPAAVPPATAGVLDLAVQADQAGAGGNVPVAAMQLILSPTGGLSGVTNPVASSGGEPVESDELYRNRLLLELGAPQGAGNVADYQRWALAYPGVGFVTVIPLWDGPGTVRVIVTDSNNDPVPQAIIDAIQAVLDPVPAEGRGLAPIGATVTVDTPVTVTVNVEATPAPAGVRHRKDYSLDGDSGTRPTRERIETALREYIDQLAPGEDVILQHVEAQFFRVRGVYNVLGVELNGAADDVTVGDLEVAALGTITLHDLGQELV